MPAASRARRSPIFHRPFPLQALEEALGSPPTGAVAVLLGLHPNQVRRWRDTGLTDDQADRLAVHVGLHASEVWEQWWDVPDDD